MPNPDLLRLNKPLPYSGAKEKRASLQRFLGGVSILIVLAGVLRIPAVQEVLAPEYLHPYIQQFGAAAPMVYMGLYVVLSVLLFPASVLSLAGGLLFGTLWGSVYIVIAATIAAVIAFALGRYVGRGFVSNWMGSHLLELEARITGEGFWPMVVLRLLLLPYIPLSYAAGLTRMRVWDFTVATFLVNIPGSLALTYVGSSLVDPGKVVSALIVFLIVMGIPVGVICWKRRGRNHVEMEKKNQESKSFKSPQGRY